MGAMGQPRRGSKDLTVIAVPFYFATMAAEYLWLRRGRARRGPTAGDFERRDTVASLAMGLGSLIAPLIVPKLLRPFTPGRGRYGKAVVLVAVGAVAVTTVADVVARRADTRSEELELTPSREATTRRARKIASVGGVTAVVVGGVAITTAWSTRTTAQRFWRHRLVRKTLTGPVALLVAIFGWDFIYYWNHRFMHESRYMWAVHVVHHSSERYNLSTALRQPVADALGTFLPQGVLCLAGFQPGLISSARGINLVYQFWIHTETIGRLGPLEKVFNTPSHHRVHHGSNPQYIDRNHGSILIIWDRLFGTFEQERERVIYGLTRNIKTFNPLKIAAHEHLEMLGDVFRSQDWRDRLSVVVRGPGWAYRRHDELVAA